MSDQLTSALVCFVCVCVYVWVGGASDGFEGSESSVETLCFSDLHHYDVRTTYRLFFSDCPPDLSPLHGYYSLYVGCSGRIITRWPVGLVIAPFAFGIASR